MHRRTRTAPWRWRASAAAACMACAAMAQAQVTITPAPALTLKQAFEAAWAREPEAVALQARREAAEARQQAARAWTPEPAAIELSGKTDRWHRNDGAREYEIGVALPLWLPGERSRSASLAEAEAGAIETRAAVARLRSAATVRTAWWQWQRARIEAEIADVQLGSARQLAADVARRHDAGDMARADRHQADAAVAAAQAAQAGTQAELAEALQHLQAAIGLPLPGEGDRAPSTGITPDSAEAEPDTADVQPARLGGHPALQALEGQAAVAQRSAALAAVQTRANPELTVAATRERGAFGEGYAPTITVAVRIPFGAGDRHGARMADTRADAAELQAQLAMERSRVAAEQGAAQARVGAARARLTAAERHLQLAQETRGFFDRSFRLGETDLPTRLRVEAEAAGAERQSARARIELAAAVSAWRQALGLLPQ